MAELQATMSATEFAEWMLEYRFQPWGEDRADYRAAIVAATIANRHRDPKHEPQPYRPQDFVPRYGPPADPVGRRQSPQEIKAVFRALTQGVGGTLQQSRRA